MKSNKFLLIMTGVLLFYGCSDDNPLSTEVTEVGSLYAPADGFNAELNPNGNLTFEWERAKAEDGGMVMYEVAFDFIKGKGFFLHGIPGFMSSFYSVTLICINMKNRLKYL